MSAPWIKAAGSQSEGSSSSGPAGSGSEFVELAQLNYLRLTVLVANVASEFLSAFSRFRWLMYWQQQPASARPANLYEALTTRFNVQCLRSSELKSLLQGSRFRVDFLDSALLAGILDEFDDGSDMRYDGAKYRRQDRGRSLITNFEALYLRDIRSVRHWLAHPDTAACDDATFHSLFQKAEQSIMFLANALERESWEFSREDSIALQYRIRQTEKLTLNSEILASTAALLELPHRTAETQSLAKQFSSVKKALENTCESLRKVSSGGDDGAKARTKLWSLAPPGVGDFRRVASKLELIELPESGGENRSPVLLDTPSQIMLIGSNPGRSEQTKALFDKYGEKNIKRFQVSTPDFPANAATISWSDGGYQMAMLDGCKAAVFVVDSHTDKDVQVKKPVPITNVDSLRFGANGAETITRVRSFFGSEASVARHQDAIRDLLAEQILLKNKSKPVLDFASSGLKFGIEAWYELSWDDDADRARWVKNTGKLEELGLNARAMVAAIATLEPIAPDPYFSAANGPSATAVAGGPRSTRSELQTMSDAELVSVAQAAMDLLGKRMAASASTKTRTSFL